MNKHFLSAEEYTDNDFSYTYNKRKKKLKSLIFSYVRVTTKESLLSSDPLDEKLLTSFYSWGFN